MKHQVMLRPLQLNFMFLGLKPVRCRVGRSVKIILLTTEGTNYDVYNTTQSSNTIATYIPE